MRQGIKILFFIFIWSSTCFGRHTAHHQEHKTALAASGFAYVEGCWTCSCWTLASSSCTKFQQDAIVSKFYFSYLYEARHVSGDTPSIIRSLKLHWQPLVFHTWKIVWMCSWWTLSNNYTSKQPSTYEKPEAASAVLGSWWWAMCRPKHVELHINME